MDINQARLQWDMDHIDPPGNHFNEYDQYQNGYGQILDRNEAVIIDNNCEVSSLNDYYLDEAFNVCAHTNDKFILCPSCGRKIDKFESHSVYIAHDEIMACEDSPRGEAWEFEDRLTAIV